MAEFIAMTFGEWVRAQAIPLDTSCPECQGGPDWSTVCGACFERHNAAYHAQVEADRQRWERYHQAVEAAGQLTIDAALPGGRPHG